MGLRARPCSDSSLCPHQMVFGTEPYLPADFISRDAHEIGDTEFFEKLQKAWQGYVYPEPSNHRPEEAAASATGVTPSPSQRGQIPIPEDQQQFMDDMFKLVDDWIKDTGNCNYTTLFSFLLCLITHHNFKNNRLYLMMALISKSLHGCFCLFRPGRSAAPLGPASVQPVSAPPPLLTRTRALPRGLPVFGDRPNACAVKRPVHPCLSGRRPRTGSASSRQRCR